MADQLDRAIKRRDFLKAGAALGLAVPTVGAFLAACSSGTASEAPASSAAASEGAASQAPAATGGTVNLYDTMPEATAKYWNSDLLPEYQAKYPGWTIKETNGGIEDPLKLRTLIASKTADSPDMAWMESGEMGAYAAAGLLADVDSWLTGKPDVKADIFPALVELCTYEGKVQSLPWMTNNTACLINVDAFEAAGVPIPSQNPEETWTWQEFEAACKAVTEKAGMKGLLLSSTQNGWDAWLFHAWLGAAGGQFITAEGDPVFNGPEGIETMTFIQSLVKNGYTAPLDKGWELALWYSKTAAITINGPWNFPDLQKFTDFKFTVVPFPRNKKPATNIGGNNLFVYNIHPEAVEGALNYAEYMLSTDFQVKFNLQSGNLPVTKSATAHPDYQAQLEKYPFLKGWVNHVPFGVARSALPQGNDTRNAFGSKAWDPIVLQGADVKTALDDAATAVAALKGA